MVPVMACIGLKCAGLSAKTATIWFRKGPSYALTDNSHHRETATNLLWVGCRLFLAGSREYPLAPHMPAGAAGGAIAPDMANIHL